MTQPDTAVEQLIQQGHEELVGDLARVLDIEAGLEEILPLFPPDAERGEATTVTSSPFLTPDQVDASWNIKTPPAYDQLKLLVERKLQEKPSSHGGYSLDIPHGIPQHVIQRVRDELELQGWTTNQGSSLKNEAYLEWRKRPAR